tara:strand:+ start:6068 stop:6274 length:207 start_codon:yes stop_codon:yes gene_type:complete
MDTLEELISFHAKRGNAELVQILHSAVAEYLEFLGDECESSECESSEHDSEEEGYEVHVDDNGFHSLV